MNRRNYIFIIGVICLAVLCIFIVYSSHSERKAAQAPSVRDGAIDLTDWNFAANGAVRLDGQWEFTWGKLMKPEVPMELQGYYSVPSHWKGDFDGTQLHAKGAATYRLRVKVNPSAPVYGLSISNIRMASSAYVNGVKVGSSGQPGLSRNTYTMENKPYNAYFHLQGDTADIVIQTSNFDFVEGGIPYSIYFGTAAAINQLNRNVSNLNIIVIVALTMLGLYHLAFYLMRREEQGLLYFGLYCIVLGLAFSCNGDRVFMEYFNLPIELFYKLLTTSLFLTLVMMGMFIKSMCSGLIPSWLTKGIVGITGLYICFVLLTPFRTYSNYNFMFGYFQNASYFIIICMLIVSYFKGRFGGFGKRALGLWILALIGFFVCLIDYSLYLAGNTSDYYIGYFGIMCFCILISLLLSYRFSDAFRTIENMTVRLKEADRLKDEFLANTSHEFQTPLHGMILLTQSMLEEAEGGLYEKQKQQLSVILASSRRLSAMVNDILDLEKIKRNELRLHLASVDVAMTVSVVFELFPFLTSGKNVKLVNGIPEHLPPVYADEDRLKQILYNLIGNAVKFTETGTVTISAECVGDRVKIAVEDTGLGIPEIRWSDIFRSFDQGDSHISRQYGGTGLGLSISRKLVSLMNGDIFVEWSEVGAGTRFAMLLPIAEGKPVQSDMRQDGTDAPAVSPIEIADRRAEGSDRFTLLAVDDEPSNLLVLSNLFNSDDYNLLFATSGQEALHKIQTCADIDLVLLDVMMPKMSGYEVCREIRSSYPLFDIPIIMLTVRHTPSDIAAGFECGANDFISKPFDAWEIRARVETLLLLRKSVKDALKTELAFLQSQIKPHFLYNALNAILSFCRTDSERAAELISHLGYYLRRSFEPGIEMFTTLQDELDLVQAYVAIEKARFGDRLTVEFHIDSEAMSVRIPPLTIQPLVENAIRHGVTKKEDGGIVRLTVKAKPDEMVVEVWDNGVGISHRRRAILLDTGAGAKRPETGVGLFNINRRLLRFFGEGLQLESMEGQWTKVAFQISLVRKGM